ncbi:MAG: hypothetical protein IPM29_20210 [Planctomycetes bacterium]|nr:hypothetical protein [Planctomycetota bacterium]
MRSVRSSVPGAAAAALAVTAPVLAATQEPAGEQAIQTQESFLFLNLPPTWVVALVVLPLTIGFAWWAYGGLSRLEPRTRLLLASLRGLAIAACLFLAFQPAIERVRYTEVQSQVHVLVDDSASMRRKDTYPDDEQRDALQAELGARAEIGALSRAQLVEAVLEAPGGLLERLRAEHDVRLFRFERKPVPITDLAEVQGRSPRTAIGDALDLHLATAGAVNLDTVLLVSDGRNNDGLSPVDVAAKYELEDITIYTIGVGDPNPPKNIRLIGPPGPEQGLAGEELVFECTVDAEGLAGRSVTVTMSASRDHGPYAAAGEPVQLTLADDHVPLKARVYARFDEPGDYTLKFEVDALPDETSREDNEAIRFLRIDDTKIRVLYIEDLPRWEYRYLKNALLRVDPSIEAQCWLFDASRSFTQESTQGLEPLRDLPRTREELFRYQVILLGDVPPERLAPNEELLNDWLQLLVEFTEAGGGVGFLWGEQAMPDRYRNTPVEDLLPVVLESPAALRDDPAPRNTEFLPRLDNPAQPHDIVLLQRDPRNNRRLFERGFQTFTLYYPVQKAKAGADVLLRHPTRGNRYGLHPLAVAGQFPRGRTFFWATDESWRWRNPYGEKYHDRFWRNVVRYLASGRLRRRDERFDLRLDRATVPTGGQVEVTLLAQDEEFQPVLVDEFPIFVRRADGSPERRMLRPLPAEPGSYRGRFTMDEPGSFSFLVFEDANPGAAILAREDLLVKIPDREMAESSQDRATLEAIAGATRDGRYVFLPDAAELVDDFGRRGAPRDRGRPLDTSALGQHLEPAGGARDPRSRVDPPEAGATRMSRTRRIRQPTRRRPVDHRRTEHR